MEIKIYPKKLNGTIKCMPSKSYSHRAIIAASLSSGSSTISNLVFSDDVLATIDACKAIGASINCFSNYVEIQGVSKVGSVSYINARESGSTMRFMIPICLTTPQNIEFYGCNNLVKRPLDAYYKIFDEQNISYEIGNDYLPMQVSGCLKSGKYVISGNVSSQYITGLLYALPLLDGDSEIIISSNLESRGYVMLTLDILNKFGISILNNNFESFYIKGNQTYKAYNYVVEGDYSQAAFFLAAGLLGNNIKVDCLNLESYQADKKILSDLVCFGGKLGFVDNLICGLTSKLNGTVIDFAQSPDLGPILSVIAALSQGKTTFINTSRLRIKECDRITCMKEELNKLGACVSETNDTMSFVGVSKLNGDVSVNCHNDHRIAMALTIASTVCNHPITLFDASCVRKSYPHFWDDFKKIGGEFDVID